MNGAPIAVVLVTGLSGAGKNSILRALEDLGFETMDNPPLATLEDLAARSERNVAIGVDARSRGLGASADSQCRRWTWWRAFGNARASRPSAPRTVQPPPWSKWRWVLMIQRTSPAEYPASSSASSSCVRIGPRCDSFSMP